MTIRNLALTAALAIASVVALAAPASPASAQTYGGVTLSFGSGGYDDDDDSHALGGYYYADPRYRNYRVDYYNRGDAWRARQRAEQIERWREDQRRRQYWAHERREHQQWHDRDEDDED